MTRPNPPSWLEAGATVKNLQDRLKGEAEKEKGKKMGALRKVLLVIILACFIGYAIFRHFFITGLGF